MKIISTLTALIWIATSTEGLGAEPKAVEVGGSLTSHRLMRESKDDIPIMQSAVMGRI